MFYYACQFIMTKKLLALGFCLFLFMACQTRQQNHDADHFTLTGNLQNAVCLSLQIQELTTNEVIPLDSFETDSAGYFFYRGTLAESSFFILRIDQANFITLLIEPGEEIIISGDAKNFKNDYTVRGSDGSQLISCLYNSLRHNQMLLDSLAEVYASVRDDANLDEVEKELNKAYEKIWKDQKKFVKRFIKKNPQSLASIIALYQSLGNQSLLNERDHFVYFEALSKSLSEVYPTNKHVLDLHRRVSRHKRNELKRSMLYDKLAVGNKAPEVILPDPNGQMLALSSFRGNYVLIDFWASWCTPCRRMNADLRHIYEKYNDYGFEIYGISLDRSREQWIQGITEDSIPWPQVSDLRLWNSPVVSLYNVSGIPYSVLINPEGIIVDKGVDIDELSEYLASAFDK